MSSLASGKYEGSHSRSVTAELQTHSLFLELDTACAGRLSKRAYSVSFSTVMLWPDGDSHCMDTVCRQLHSPADFTLSVPSLLVSFLGWGETKSTSYIDHCLDFCISPG
jgi:hypothetical protein